MRKKFPDGKGGTRSVRKGKLAAQASHASIAFLTKRIQENVEGVRTPDEFSAFGDFDVWGYLGLSFVMKEWLQTSFAKITLGVETEKDLLDIYEKAKEAELEVHLVTDSGKTEFSGVPTNTGLAIGPDYSEKIDPITQGLSLL